MCFCCRQLLLFVWSQYQRSESYNFLMCPLTTEPTCLISCRCVCVSEPHCFPWDVWFHAALPTFLFPLPVSCCHFTPINTHMCMCTHTHTQSGGVNSRKSTTSFDQTRGPSSVWWLFVWHPALLSDSLQSGWGEGGGIGGCQPWTWVDSRGCRCAQKNNPSVKYTAASLLVREVLTVSISSSNSGTSGQWGLKLQGGVGDCDTTVIEDLRRAGFCMGSDVGYGVRM